MRVAIVNDMGLATEALRRVVLSGPDHVVAWTAVDGEEAVRRCEEDTPEVVLMDLLMPVMNGAEATREIMRRCPCPILVVTATVAGNYSLVCEALGHGAYDAVCTPVLGNRSPAEAGADLLAKLRSVGRVQRHLRNRPELVGRIVPTTPAPAQPGAGAPAAPLVAIGASTGGPQALGEILSRLAADFPAGIVIVQHIGVDFADALARWLQDRSPMSVRIAEKGDRPQAGGVLVAGTDDHLVMTRRQTLDYTVEPESHPFRPSVDVFFQSLADHWPQASTAVLLTGIGRDGAAGLLRLRQAGWHTIAEDESTCVVYGMPQAAREMGAAGSILPVDRIADEIVRHVARSSTRS